jgi:hypothetical protein
MLGENRRGTPSFLHHYHYLSAIVVFFFVYCGWYVDTVNRRGLDSFNGLRYATTSLINAREKERHHCFINIDPSTSTTVCLKSVAQIVSAT